MKDDYQSNCRWRIRCRYELHHWRRNAQMSVSNCLVIPFTNRRVSRFREVDTHSFDTDWVIQPLGSFKDIDRRRTACSARFGGYICCCCTVYGCDSCQVWTSNAGSILPVFNSARAWTNSGASVISGAAWARTTATFARKQSSHKHALTVWLDVMVNIWPSRFLLEMVSTIVIAHYSSIITHIVWLCSGILNGEGDHWNVSRNKETTYKYFSWNERGKVIPNLIFHMCSFQVLCSDACVCLDAARQ